ncbi:hypothetical protein TTHERM_00193950 (macronuclear) [Tetrahymena thermophila SB210]|uniref:Uncharacterized protein n=1 Tax=Tetrahymena thermophila (strain SB210) TaxID=312017 RepID=Q23KE0_TETTS|nr:hypothetical protein TTHERM_00193950 [Tetrahymena thermophila SB210]7TGH_P2 Chain P2, NDUPH2 [Tetrahymena thermophila]8B6F_BE Chain BE, NDUPH2 [Tetrahymena thermophila SB210]8BQS_BE Chain BE, NDUPH2 [Tetrahymena thermophila SB210]8GYM_P2 Chain P2, NDUPH2 [Tetrahymena thermophila SB210]8GYM_p2 Chain p2, NDUPH2 [Tetrahymena thermophila SB210]8GZU_P2 Chain P2, NDUPH2 [Tetrahymena thermophila SB210]8GZU_p2 Chain p2, NDUPH2 [Tetrahymena thermophila SB210]EAR96903.1 hypothetical protein TTHERM|eukprot:XP_001017148.1 hypothetical protein TTHERM_00193950 [Tetrahymena thermophila SB210]
MFNILKGAQLSFRSITNKSVNNYYNIMRQVSLDSNPIVLYQSSTFTGNGLQEFYENADALTKYLKLVPFFLEKNLYDHPKQFVIKMEFHPQNKVLSLDCLTHQGVLKKTVNLENLIPVPYEDYVQFCRRKLFNAPLFLDTEMIYFNTFQNEFYVFDKNAKWNEEGINHPELDISKLYNEKAWFDSLRII